MGTVVIFRNFWPKKAQIDRQCFCWDHAGICWDVLFSNSGSFASFVAIFVPVKNQGSFQCFDIYANESLRPLWGAHGIFSDRIDVSSKCSRMQKKNHRTLYLTRVVIKLATHFWEDQTSSKCKGICPNKWRMNYGMVMQLPLFLGLKKWPFKCFGASVFVFFCSDWVDSDFFCLYLRNR